jgi:hypothetical protein
MEPIWLCCLPLIRATHCALKIQRATQPAVQLKLLNGQITKGLALYATIEWFVVRVSSLITTLKVVTIGRSEVTSIHHGFALVHESERVDPGVKGFSYGVVVGFNAGGGFVGSASLK